MTVDSSRFDKVEKKRAQKYLAYCGSVGNVKDGDPYRLAGAIINMSRNYEHAISMGRSARDRARERHNPEKVVAELLSVYNELSYGK